MRHGVYCFKRSVIAWNQVSSLLFVVVHQGMLRLLLINTPTPASHPSQVRESILTTKSDMANIFSTILDAHRPDLAYYEQLYKHFHSHPELSNQEAETASTIAELLRKLSPDLVVKTCIGGHGLVAILRNGNGKTVLLRADMDALPIKEQTGLDYAADKTMKDVDGDVKPVMHG